MGERICERYDIARTANQPAACGYVGNIAELVIRNIQQLRQFRAVGGALVQHHEKLRVCQHQAGGVGAQQLIHILRQPGHKTVVLADAFPQLVEKVCTVLIAEQNTDRSDSFEPFAPVHTVQAAFTAHGGPWDKFFIVNAVTFKVRIIYFFYNVIAGRLALARQRLILSRHGFL